MNDEKQQTTAVPSTFAPNAELTAIRFKLMEIDATTKFVDDGGKRRQDMDETQETLLG